jgi:hypothetical protein
MCSDPDEESAGRSPVKRQPAGNESGIISLSKIRDETAEELWIVEKTHVCVAVNYKVFKSARALCGLYVSVIKSECVT